MGEDNWQFINYSPFFAETVFEDGKKYDRFYIEKEHREFILQKLIDAENYIDAYQIEREMNRERYDGSCYGLSVLALYNCYSVIRPSILQTGAEYLHDVEKTKPIVSLINCHSLLQCTTYIKNKIMDDITYYGENEKIQRIITSLEAMNPALLCYRNYEETFAHAVVAYDFEKTENLFEIAGEEVTFDTKILIYDSNVSGIDDTCCMYVNMDSFDWYIPKYKISSLENDCITWVINDVNVLLKNSIFEEDPYAKLPETRISTSLDIMGVINCEVESGEDNGTGGFISSSGEKIISYYAFMFGDGSGPLRYILRDADAEYRLTMTDKPEDVELQMQYEDCLMYITATQTDNIVFHPDGLKLTQQGNSNTYSFHMVRNNVPTETSFHTIGISGKSANKLTFSYENGEWFLSGDCLENIEVQANHSTATSNTLTFSVPAKYDTVCLRQMNESTIAAFVDTNGDGEYETSVENIPEDGIPLGDVNADGGVDSLDAANILIAAALVGADMDSGLSDAQKIAADTSKNGTFGAEDAALVLQYAAAIGSGYTGEFEEFLAA